MSELKTPKAVRKFVRDATKVASVIKDMVPPGSSEVISLFVNTETGHIRIWCREKDKTADVLGMHPTEVFRKINWQIRGSSLKGKSLNSIVEPNSIAKGYVH